MLKYALLGFLKYKNMTGYELKQVIDHSTGFFWFAKQSQIYATLKKLEQDECICSWLEPQDGRPDRRVYRIVDKGIQDLDAWLVQPLTEIEPAKNTLMLKLFFSARSGRGTLLMQLRLMKELWQQALHVRRVEIPRVIEDYTNQHPDMKQDAVMWEACRKFGELHSDTVVRWLEETIAAVEKNIRK